MSSTDRYVRAGRATGVFNEIVAWLTRRGLSVWGSRVLAVRGRKSGRVAHHARQPADARRRALPRGAARAHAVGAQPAGRRRHG